MPRSAPISSGAADHAVLRGHLCKHARPASRARSVRPSRRVCRGRRAQGRSGSRRGRHGSRRPMGRGGSSPRGPRVVGIPQVLIFDGDDEDGAARELADQLTEAGFHAPFVLARSTATGSQPTSTARRRPRRPPIGPTRNGRSSSAPGLGERGPMQSSRSAAAAAST